MSSNFHGILHYFEFLGGNYGKTNADRLMLSVYQRQKCSPMTLVSGSIRPIGLFAGISIGGDVKWQWSCRRRHFFGDL